MTPDYPDLEEQASWDPRVGKHWLVGMIGALAVLAVSGVGFAAFTATATVNGQVSAGTVDLQIAGEWTTTANPSIFATGCWNNYTTTHSPLPDNLTFSELNAARTQVTLTATNLTPDTYCQAVVELENTGTVPVNLSVGLLTSGVSGICAPLATDCFDVITYSGIVADGWICWHSCAPTDSVTGFASLNPGGIYYDAIGVSIPPGAGDGTPSSATFSLDYTGSAGL